MPAKKSKATKSSDDGAISRAVGPMPPGGPIEIVFSFDTTGSMSGVLGEVRKQVQEVINRLFKDIPMLKIAVFAHGDYCDKGTYVTKYVDFTNDAKKLCHFVETVKSTGGGDWEECYELVLRQVQQQLSWTPGTQRSLVMIGDAIPHDTKYAQNKDKIDWKVETSKLYNEMGVHIYAVQSGKNSAATSFWEDMAKMTDGKHLDLDQFRTIIDMIMAICYRETGPDFFLAYEKEVRAREGAGIRSELDDMFNVLRDSTEDDAVKAPASSKTAKTARKSRVSASKNATKTSDGSVTFVRGTKRSLGDSDDDTDGAAINPGKKAKAEAKKPWPLKKKSSSIVAAKLIKKAKMGRPRSKPHSDRQRRELVPQTRFALNTLKWTTWCEAMLSNPPSSDDGAGAYSDRRGVHVGVRNTTLFHNDTGVPAVYEFAVQAKQRCKKYPVYFSTTRGFSRLHWDTYLLKQEGVNKQVDEVLKKGCKLYVRRAKVEKPVKCDDQVVSSVQELRSLMTKTYDYAWSSPNYRQVGRTGLTVSIGSC